MSYKKYSIHKPIFEYNDSSISISCTFSFERVGSAPTKSFEEKLSIDYSDIDTHIDIQNLEDIQSYVELIAIACAPSYFKASPTNKIIIDFPITKDILEWANALFDNGLREFRFQNNLDLTTVPTIEGELISKKINSEIFNNELVLLPVGGGKDSATSLSILQAAKKDIVGFSVGDFEAIRNTMDAGGIKYIRATRKIDSCLLQWNDEGALNGHVPVTAVTSTLACLAGYIIGAGSVIMSNEASANEATRTLNNIEVNHQYSKSFEGEKLLRNSITSHTKIGVNYFSLLRTLSEYDIFTIFANATQFHKSFISCNRAFKIDKDTRSKSWCGECDKCRFVFIGLCAFLDIKTVETIFGNNLLDDKKNMQGFFDLIGVGDGKPFECVGTLGETVLLMKKALAKFSLRKYKKLRKALSEIKDIEFLSVNENLNQGYGINNFIPDEYLEVIKNIKKANYKREVLNTLVDTKIGIIGLGRDTAGVIRYLENIGYENGISIFLPDDQNITDEEFLKANKELQINDVGFTRKLVRNKCDLKSCNLIFASPGISKYGKIIKPITKKVTTPLAWWLAINKQILPQKIFIGITGTKGKSTTSSMLSHALSDSVLVGNIGNSVGSLPLDDLLEARYVVLEVSSFQASYINVSPHVGVLTSLFDCHIDWHITPEKYSADKQNLFDHNCDVVFKYGEVDNLTLDEQNKKMVTKVLNSVNQSLSNIDIKDALENFPGLKYRKEIVANKNGIIYISDVLATAPQASVEAIKDIAKTHKDSKIFLLYGGANRNVDQSIAIKEFNELDLDMIIVTLPETGHEIEDKLNGFKHCEELEDGVKWASDQAKNGDVIVLAPGAPSFHRYKNYEKLQEHFIELIDKL